METGNRIAAASPSSAPTAREAMDLRYHVERSRRRRCRSEQRANLGAQHAFAHGVIEERLHRRPESADVEKHDRLGVIAELDAGQDLERFLEGAEPAGRDDERI